MWLLDRVGGAIDPNELEDHAMPADPVKAYRPRGVGWYQYIAMELCAAHHVSPVAAVTSCRTDRAGRVVVTYTGIDGRDYDLSAYVDGSTGRLIAPLVAHSTRGVEVSWARAGEQSGDEYARLGGVVRACYDDVDEDWLQRRLGSGSDFTIARRGGEALGFCLSGVFEADGLELGDCRISFGGLWIRPDARGLQLGSALQVWQQVLALIGEIDVSLLSFASPITFGMQFPGIWSWPGAIRAGALDALAAASDRVRSFTAQAAVAAGSTSFDEQHWIAHGLEHGTPNAELRGIDPAVTSLFRHVDQPNGDTLTIPASIGPPPAFLRL
jgi:hypothetical protein